MPRPIVIVGLACLITVRSVEFRIAAQEDRDDARGYLSAISESRARRPPHALSLQRRVKSEFVEGWPSPPWEATYRVDYRSQNGKHDALIKRFRSQNGQLVSDPVEDGRMVWDGEQWWSFSEGKRRDPALPAHPRLSLTADIGRARKWIAGGPLGAALTDVFYADTEPFYDILASASELVLSPTPEDVDGYACLVLRAETNHGEYTIWIDPQADFAVRRAHVLKEGTDIAWGRSLNHMKEPSVIPVTGRKPPGPYVTVEYLFEDIEYIKVGETFMPVSSTETATVVYENGAKEVVSFENHYSNIEFNPDFESMGAFRPDFPDGTRVFLAHAPGLEYEWRRGGVVPKIPEVMISTVLENIDAAIMETEISPPERGGASTGVVVLEQSDLVMEHSDPAADWSARRVSALVAGVMILFGSAAILVWRRKL